MRHRALRVSLSVFAALLIGCSKSDFPTTPSPVADTPLTTLAALKVDGSASLPGGGQTPFNMTLIARSLNFTAPGAQAQTPGTTEVNGNFVLGTGVKGTVTGSIQGSLENGTLLGTLTSSADACTRQYNGPISTAGLAWLASDSTGGCPLPITVQASRADAPSACTYSISPVGSVPGGGGHNRHQHHDRPNVHLGRRSAGAVASHHRPVHRHGTRNRDACRRPVGGPPAGHSARRRAKSEHRSDSRVHGRRRAASRLIP